LAYYDGASVLQFCKKSGGRGTINLIVIVLSVILLMCINGIMNEFFAIIFVTQRTVGEKLTLKLRVAKSQVKCPTPTPTFPKFPTADSELSNISNSKSSTQSE